MQNGVKLNSKMKFELVELKFMFTADKLHGNPSKSSLTNHDLKNGEEASLNKLKLNLRNWQESCREVKLIFMERIAIAFIISLHSRAR